LHFVSELKPHAGIGIERQYSLTFSGRRARKAQTQNRLDNEAAERW
jgi:hypothetical protein